MKLHERLLAGVKVSTVNSWNGMSCLEWQGTLNNYGYGQMRVGSIKDGSRKVANVHRVSWQEFRGKIPAGLWVLHHCDNPRCCNVAHLFLGTHGDNMKDRSAKGRHAFGEANGQSKLCDADIPTIRHRLAAGETQVTIARDYGVGQQLICRIGQRQRWAHVA